MGYYQLQRYLTTNVGALPAGSSGRFPTSNLQLNSIPDKIIIFGRKQMSQQRSQDPDKFLVIKNISVNFNNASGLLASASQQDLYKMSIDNNSNQSWYEFSGGASKYDSSGAGNGKSALTSGSLLVLSMGKDVQITEDFLTQGSIGQYSLQCNIEFENPAGSEDLASSDWEIVLVTMQSGALVNERGTTSTYTAMITKQLCLDANKEEPVSESQVKRIVGGGFLDNLKTGMSAVHKYGKPVMDIACKLMNQSGSGITGSGEMGAGLMSDALSVVGLGKDKKKKMRMAHPLDSRL